MENNEVKYMVAKILKQKYQDFAHFNLKNPLHQLLFILCSTKTPEKNYRATYKALRSTFPKISSVAEAPTEYIAKSIELGGLQNQKAETIKVVCNAIQERFGRLTLAPLRYMNDVECEDFLTSLPRIGKKITRCIMMYSLERQVYPVDTHCWRISKRLGWITPSLKDGSCSQKDMDRLQDVIPPDIRFSLHVNMLSLGRKICTAKSPECQICPINCYCPKIGV